MVQMLVLELMTQILMELVVIQEIPYYQKIIDTGMNIYAYTVNQKRRWRCLIDVGVKGCFSDFLIEKNILEKMVISFMPSLMLERGDTYVE